MKTYDKNLQSKLKIFLKKNFKQKINLILVLLGIKFLIYKTVYLFLSFFIKSELPFLKRITQSYYTAFKPELSIDLFGIKFKNRLGLAAGFDKNADYIDTLFALGFGFIEVGTVTPKPQPGNPKPRLFRVVKANALINRLGFNNKGVAYLVNNLKHRKSKGVVGVNIGKNKDTPMERAVEDYLFCLEQVYAHADYIVINIY